MDIGHLLRIIIQVTCTFPAIAGITCYRRLSKGAKILTYYFVIAAIVDIVSFYLVRSGHNSVILYHFFDPIEYFCFVFAFSYWTGNVKLTKILRFSIIGFFMLSLINSLRMQDIFHYSFAALSIAYLVYVLVSSLTISNLIRNDTGVIHTNPVFWLAASLFVMSANNALFYMVGAKIPNPEFANIYLFIHQIVNIVASFLATIGLVLYRYVEQDRNIPEVSVYWN